MKISENDVLGVRTDIDFVKKKKSNHFLISG